MKISKKSIGNKIIILTVFFITFFSPLSIKGNVLSSNLVIIQWGVFTLSLYIMMIRGRINKKRFSLSIILLFYLGIGTIFIIFSKDFIFNIARFIPFLCSIMLVMSNFSEDISPQLLIKSFNIVMLIIIIINVLLFIKEPHIVGLVTNSYTQYLKVITENYINLRRPIGLFGVANIASFIYSGLFLISYCLYDVTQKKIYVFYLGMLFLFNLLLRSSTSLGYALCMMAIFIYKNRKSYKIVFILGIVGMISIFVINSQIFIDFTETLKVGVNGFAPRYLTGANVLYKDNYQVLQDYVLGIGFSIPVNGSYNIYFADSGYIILYTMGNFIYPIIYYSLFYYWIKDNLKRREYRIYFLGYALLMELGFISFLALKSLGVYLILMIYLKKFLSIENNGEVKTYGE